MPSKNELATMIGLAIHSGLRIHDSPLSGATMSAYNAIIGVDPGVWETICRDAADRVIAAYDLLPKNLLQEIHDEMDEVNNNTVSDKYYCLFCGASRYDASGIIHKNDCVFTKIRKSLKE